MKDPVMRSLGLRHLANTPRRRRAASGAVRGLRESCDQTSAEKPSEALLAQLPSGAASAEHIHVAEQVADKRARLVRRQLLVHELRIEEPQTVPIEIRTDAADGLVRVRDKLVRLVDNLTLDDFFDDVL